MSFRKVSTARGAGWIVDGLAVFTSNPGPFLSLCLLVGLLSSLPLVSLFAGLFSVVFYGGIVSALHRQAQGGTPHWSQAFEGFSRPGALGRLIVLVLLNIALAVFALIVLAIALGPAMLDLIRQGSAAQPSPELLLSLLPRAGIALLILLPLGVLVGWVTLLAVPRAMLDEVPGLTAIREALAVIAANFGALLVNLLCLLAVMLVAVAVLMVPMFLINLLSTQRPLLGLLLQVPLMTVFTAAVFALYGSIMYQAWREIHGSEPKSSTASPSSVEL